MDTNEVENKISILQELVDNGKTQELAEALEDFPTALVVDFLTEKSETEIIRFLKMIHLEDAGRIFSNFTLEQQHEIFKILDRRTFSQIYTHMYSDSRADLFQEFDKQEQIEILRQELVLLKELTIKNSKN